MSAIAKAEQASTAMTTGRVTLMAESLAQESEQRKLLGQYVRHHMVEGTDFGTIPGTERKTLLKPGAEKLTELFRCSARFELVEKVEEWERGFFHYLFRVRIVYRDTDTVLAEGFGSCNSKEGRYRWRKADRKCPHCGKEAIIKGKAEFGGGWMCWKKKDGCGAKFADDDAAITGQAAGKVENDDIYTLVNTILKMAKKRALVDGAIALARCSDMFTQDVEDFQDPDHAPDADERRQQQKPAPAKVEQPNREPAKVANPGDVQAARTILKGCRSLKSLATAWDILPPEVQKALKPDKEQFKGEPTAAETKAKLAELARQAAEGPALPEDDGTGEPPDLGQHDPAPARGVVAGVDAQRR